MVDVMAGIIDLDKVVVEPRKSEEPIYVVANKVDNTERIGLSSEFYSFGLGDVFDVSATNGSGTGNLG